MLRVLKWTVLLLLGVVIFAGMLLWKYPASRALSQLLPTPSQWTSIEGTLLAGEVIGLSIDGVPVGDVQWQLDVGSLLMLKADLALTVSHSVQSGSARLQRSLFSSATHISDLRGRAGSRWIQHILQQPGVVLGGEVEFDIQQLWLDENGMLVSIDGEATWRDASIRVDSSVSLGSIQTRWTTDEKGIRGQINDLGGLLEVIGDVTLSESEYRVTLAMKPRYPDAVLEQSLALFGPSDKVGLTHVSIRGPLLSIHDLDT